MSFYRFAKSCSRVPDFAVSVSPNPFWPNFVSPRIGDFGQSRFDKLGSGQTGCCQHEVDKSGFDDAGMPGMDTRFYVSASGHPIFTETGFTSKQDIDSVKLDLAKGFRR